MHLYAKSKVKGYGTFLHQTNHSTFQDGLRSGAVIDLHPPQEAHR